MKYKLQELPEVSTTENIFFVGIKGVGVAPLALIANDAAKEVGGSDVDEEFITDQCLRDANIQVSKGFATEDIEVFFKDKEIDKSLVVTTGAHKGYDNPQVKWAKSKGISVLSQGQALAVFMDGEIFDRQDMAGIAVAGSHGKTTISSLLATTLKALGLAPTYCVGTGEVFPLGPPGQLGHGKYFVAEADEYASEPVYDRVAKFLYLRPKFAIFNNIDFDHPDLFGDISEIESAFLELAHNIKSGGMLFINGDDKYLENFDEKINKDIRIIKYGQNPSNNYVISKIVEHGFTSRFTVHKNGHELDVFELSIPGIHNAKNALSVIALLCEIGIETNKIRACLKVYTGGKRRLEKVGKTDGGASLIDDYGHHPLEVATTINALRLAFPDKKIVSIFQPHTFSRTKALLREFGKSFENVDKLLLLPVFKSMRDTEKDTIEEGEYVGAFEKYADVLYLKNFADMIEYVKKNYSSDEYLVLTIGAGDVYKIANALKNK